MASLSSKVRSSADSISFLHADGRSLKGEQHRKQVRHCPLIVRRELISFYHLTEEDNGA